MRLRDYVNARLDAGETDTVIEGLENKVYAHLANALNTIPSQDWETEISDRRDEPDGQVLIWLTGRAEPGYCIQQ